MQLLFIRQKKPLKSKRISKTDGLRGQALKAFAQSLARAVRKHGDERSRAPFLKQGANPIRPT
ncbi:hypothetical protein, partial [Escherichia coli]|uniref:hypothetical protein n=1 Tax=Escherichia coli TaxID=562 RepID=UPI001BDCA7F4